VRGQAADGEPVFRAGPGQKRIEHLDGLALELLLVQQHVDRHDQSDQEAEETGDHGDGIGHELGHDGRGAGAQRAQEIREAGAHRSEDACVLGILLRQPFHVAAGAFEITAHVGGQRGDAAGQLRNQHGEEAGQDQQQDDHGDGHCHIALGARLPVRILQPLVFNDMTHRQQDEGDCEAPYKRHQILPDLAEEGADDRPAAEQEIDEQNEDARDRIGQNVVFCLFFPVDFHCSAGMWIHYTINDRKPNLYTAIR